MANTSLLSLLTPDSGNSVIRLLQQEAGVLLPTSGFAAGQAVTSALLQLANQPGVVYNDIDLFGDAKWTPFDSVQCNHKNLISYHNGSKLSNTIFELCPDPQYDNLVRWTRRSQTLQIQDVRRDGDFNYVWFRSSAPNADTDKLVLNTFDINSVQAGVNLSTGQLVWTQQFEEWATNRQVRINFIHASVQTLSRALDKANHQGNYAFVEFELARCFSRYLSDFMAEASLEIGGTAISRHTKSSIFQKLQEIRHNVSINRRVIGENGPARAYLESLLEVIQSLVPFLPSDKIITQGLPVIGQKYFEKMSKQPLMLEYFTFIKVNSNYLVIAKKLPPLIVANPAVFATHICARTQSFYGSDDSKLSALNLVNPALSKSEKSVISTVYSSMHPVHRSWIQFKAFSQNIDKRQVPPADWFIGLNDEPQNKYLKNYEGHRSELEFFSKAKNIREFNSWCKKLYLNVERVFAKDGHLFYGTLRMLSQAVTGAKNSGRIADTAEFSASTIASAVAYFENKPTLLDQPFIEFCLNATLEKDRRMKERDALELVKPIEADDFPVQMLNELGVVVTELVTGQALKEEGLLMKHCVGGYSSSVSKGYCRIFSLSLKENPGVRSTLELRLTRTDGSSTSTQGSLASRVKVSVNQNRAKSNAQPDDTLREAGSVLEAHFNYNNTLAKYEHFIEKSDNKDNFFTRELAALDEDYAF